MINLRTAGEEVAFNEGQVVESFGMSITPYRLPAALGLTLTTRRRCPGFSRTLMENR